MTGGPNLCATQLISAAELADSLDRPDWRIIDCRFDLAQPDAGEAAYRDGHIPGALYAHLEHDLSAPITNDSGRHPLPDPARLRETFSAWGIGAGTQVVCYDAQANAFAARLWWLLRWLGHDCIAVLDGGLRAWTARNYPLDADPPAVAPTPFRGEPRAGMVATTREVAAALGGDRLCLIDARAPERFAGDKEPIDAVAGHIPGARNLPYQTNLDASDCYLPPEALKKMYARTLDGGVPEDCVVMCGSGVTACHTLLALDLAGLGPARLYAGSWSEWIRDPSRPVERRQS